MEPQEKTIEELNKQAEEYLNGWKRAKADLINYQKQAERERAQWAMFANAACVKAMLPVLDSLEAAVAPTPPLPPLLTSPRAGEETISPPFQGGVRGGLVGGIEKIRDQMVEALREMGVEQIKSVGEPVNPEFHEVIATEPSQEHATGLIIKEAQRGYTMHGKVLRAAKVIVSE
ncbi:nucleotide exchange factor GrpE [Candidatus Uhrbacteria bacterium]|nr:nucleotide exchange factor GrpE [Candidatus Uhrbacteria bacterium]